MDVTPGLRREPGPDLAAIGEEDELVARLTEEIEAIGPITFARFMDVALYDPERGYYRTADDRTTRRGDFLTAPETHPIFAATVGRFVADAWDGLGRPAVFTVREHGPGTGAFAAGLLDTLVVERPEVAAAVRYEPVDPDPSRVLAVAERLAGMGHADRVAPASPGRPPNPVTGLVIANEVLDALPTHRVVGRPDGVRELFVGRRDGAFVDVEAEASSPAIASRLATEGIELADGQRGEVCLALERWIAAAAAELLQGVVLLIDYGHPARELYDPIRRRDGTLRAYLRHRVHDDPYVHVGRQDLTAHVDVTAVERAASEAGLAHLGTTVQAGWLMALGIEGRLQAIQADPATTLESYLELRSSIVRLLDPAAMGRFRVMAFGRNWPAGRTIAGMAGSASGPGSAATS